MRLPGLFAVLGVLLITSGARADAPLRLRFDAEAQKLSVMDPRTVLTWSSDAPVLTLSLGGKEYRAARAEATPLRGADGLRVRLSDFRAGDAASRVSVTFEAVLAGDSLRLRLAPAENPGEEPLSRVDFPRRFGQTGTEPTGYLVLPNGLGAIRPFDRGAYEWRTRLYANGSHGPNMAFLGKVLAPSPSEPGPALVAIIHTPFDCDLRVETRDFTPGWRLETRPTLLEGNARRLQVNYPREVEYRFLPRGGYVECAKLYRGHLVAAGRFRTLRERLKAQPELARHLGAIIRKQYSGPVFDNNEIARAKELGVKKCVWAVGGWNFGGYDSKYPQRLPPNPKWRSPDGVTGEAGLVRTANLAREAGYVLTVHDNYSDAYQDSAEWSESLITQRADGKRQQGGMWNGGRAWIICLQEQVRLARRDLPRIRELIGRGGFFIDVTGAAGTACCYDPAHPHDNRRSAELKRELLALAKSEFGVSYTEGIYDFLIPAVDGCHKIFIPSGRKETPGTDVVPVPLLPLVFHDSVLLWDIRRANPARATDDKQPKYLPLGAYVPLYGAVPSTLDAEGKEIAERMAGAQLAEMLDHRFLADGVECSTFADGTRVVANFSAASYRDGAHTIAPGAYRISTGKP